MPIEKINGRSEDAYPTIEVAEAAPTTEHFTGLDVGEVALPGDAEPAGEATVEPCDAGKVEPADTETIEPVAQEKRRFKVNGDEKELTYGDFMKKSGATQEMWDEAPVVEGETGTNSSEMPIFQAEAILGSYLGDSSFKGEVSGGQNSTIFRASAATTLRLFYPFDDFSFGVAGRYSWGYGVNKRENGDTSDAKVGNLNLGGFGPSFYAKLTQDAGLVFDVFVFNAAWSDKGVEMAGDTGFKKISIDLWDNFTSGGERIAIGANVAYQHKISEHWSLTAGLSLDYLRRQEKSGESTEYIEAIIPRLGAGIVVRF